MQGLDDKRLSYLPGLDGLRALAVMAVLLFHDGQRWIPGGFLGVEVFFVISGFLITCVLLESRERTGGVGLKQFWFRRARRLLPTLRALARHACRIRYLLSGRSRAASRRYACRSRLRDQLVLHLRSPVVLR